jgi:hypothetical protein
MATTGGFCTKCGAPLTGDTAFCTKCGAARGPAAAAPLSAPVQQQPLTSQATSVAGQARMAYGMAAGAAGMAIAMPWQTVYGGQSPDIGRFLSAAALPAAQQVVRRSLRKPGIALAVTSVLDLTVALIMGGAGAVPAALGRLALAGTTSVLSIVSGSKAGPLRTAAGVMGIVTSVVQLGSTGWALVGGLSAGTPFLSLIPSIVAMLSTLAMAVKTTITAFRKS